MFNINKKCEDKKTAVKTVLHPIDHSWTLLKLKVVTGKFPSKAKSHVSWLTMECHSTLFKLLDIFHNWHNTIKYSLLCIQVQNYKC